MMVIAGQCPELFVMVDFGAPGMKAMGTQIIGKFWFRELSDSSYAL